MGAYNESDTSNETYSYTGTYDYDWAHAEEEGGEGEGGGEGFEYISTDPDSVVSGHSSSTFTETATFHWQSDYYESGAFEVRTQ